MEDKKLDEIIPSSEAEPAEIESSENISNNADSEVFDGQDERSSEENGSGEESDGSSQSANDQSAGANDCREPEYAAPVDPTPNNSTLKSSFVETVKVKAEQVKTIGLIQKRKLQESLYFGSSKKSCARVVVLLEPDCKNELLQYLESKDPKIISGEVLFVTTEEEAGAINAPMVVFSPCNVFSGWPVTVNQQEDLLEIIKAILVITRYAKKSSNPSAQKQPHNELGEPIDIKGYDMTGTKKGVSDGISSLKGMFGRKSNEVNQPNVAEPKSEVETS